MLIIIIKRIMWSCDLFGFKNHRKKRVGLRSRRDLLMGEKEGKKIVNFDCSQLKVPRAALEEYKRLEIVNRSLWRGETKSDGSVPYSSFKNERVECFYRHSLFIFYFLFFFSCNSVNQKKFFSKSCVIFIIFILNVE